MVKVPVGTGIGGGTLVRDTETGEVTEIPFRAAPTIIRRGTGAGPGPRPLPQVKELAPVRGPSPAELRQQGREQANVSAEELRLRLQRGQITPIEARLGLTRLSKEFGVNFSRLDIQRVLGSGINLSQLRAQTKALPQIARAFSKAESERQGRTVSFTPQQLLNLISTERLFGISPKTIPITTEKQFIDIPEGVDIETTTPIPERPFLERRLAEEELPPLELGEKFKEKLPPRLQPFVDLPAFALDVIERGAPTRISLKGEPVSPIGTLFEKTTTPTALGQGTSLVDIKIRPKTLEEELEGVNPEDLQNLKEDIGKIQFDFASGAINQTVAQQQVDTRLNKFTSNQIKKGIVPSIAIGGALGFLGATVPFFNVIAGTAIGVPAFLDRRQILNQFKGFPKETASVTAGFIAGGLVGGLAGGFATSFKVPKIDAKNLESVTRITGLSKDKFVKLIETNNKGFLNLRSSGKISDTVVYDIKLSDGRTFRILEFGKTKIDPFSKKKLVSDRGFLGAEVNVIEGQQVFGASTARLGRQTGVGERFTRVISFKPKGRTLTSDILRVEDARVTDLATKFSVFKIDATKSGVISNSVVLKMKNLNPSILRRIALLERKLLLGQKITINELRNLVNLQRSSRGEAPFSEAEFKAGGFPTITGTIVERLLKSAKLTVQQNEQIVGGSLSVKAVLRGEAFTFPKPDLKKPSKVPSTPLEFGATVKNKALFNKGLRDLIFKFRDAKARFGDLIKTKGSQAQVQRVKNEFGRIRQQLENLDRSFPTSAGELSLALSSEIRNNPIQKLSLQSVRFISRLTPALRSLVGNDNLLNSRIIQVQKIGTNLQSKLDLKLKLVQNSTTLSSQDSLSALKQQTKQNQQVLQNLKQLQRLNQQLRLKNITIQDLSLSTIPQVPTTIRTGVGVPIPLPSLGKARPGKPFGVPEKKNQGYHAFAKQKGIKKRLNKVPLTKRQARDLSSFLVDNSTSRTGGIVRAINKKSLRPQTKIPKGYFGKTSKKYRPFRIVQGRKVPLFNEFIERTKFAIDTKGEKRGLSIARVLAKRRKKIPLLSPISNKKKPFKPDSSTLSKNLNKKRRKK